MCRQRADRTIKAGFAPAGAFEDGRLVTHSLRRTFARCVYEHAEHDLTVLKAAFGHPTRAGEETKPSRSYLEIAQTGVGWWLIGGEPRSGNSSYAASPRTSSSNSD